VNFSGKFSGLTSATPAWGTGDRGQGAVMVCAGVTVYALVIVPASPLLMRPRQPLTL
jgi:hypothetical protein